MVNPPFELNHYSALSKEGGFVQLRAWSSITITGNDRQVFLHNFCTNDIRSLAPGQCCEAFITNVKGKVVSHGLVTCRDESLVLISVPQQAATLIAHLDRYIIREDVQLQDSTSNRAYFLLAGDSRRIESAISMAPTRQDGQSILSPLVNVESKLGDVRVRWIRWDLLGPVFCRLLEVDTQDTVRVRDALVQKQIQPCGEAAFHALRIEAGTPLFGLDFDERNLPQEVGRNERAISFTKGCYLGQETVARIDALGHVNQQLAGVRVSGDAAPNVGAELRHAGKTAGHVTSATYSPKLQAPLALAMVRREQCAVGTRLESPAGPCEVISLPVEPM
jgi:folate-binding protein YgfZ